MRYPHYLRPAKGGKWPQRVLAVDCESIADTPDTRTAVQTERLASWKCTELVLSEDTYLVHSQSTGSTAPAWWEWLCWQLRDTRSTWIISERCGRVWPLLELWQQIECGNVRIIGHDPYDEQGEDTTSREIRSAQQSPLAPISSGARNRALERQHGLLVIADPPCILTARVQRLPCRVTWIDCRNYSVSLPETIRRGTDSVLWIVQFWRDYHTLCKSLHLGSAQATTGSQSLHGWRVGYYHGGVYAGGSPEVTALEQSALIGGRCEALRIGKIDGPVYHLDIRSAYAAQCVKESVPIRIKRVHHYPSPSDVRALTEAHACIASVVISTEEPAYPYRRLASAIASEPSPSGNNRRYAGSDDTDIIYPVGTYETTLCGPELRDAILLGRIRTCRLLATYHSAPILADYARSVYSAREQAEREYRPAMATVCKALLVAIVGKFGQRDRRWITCPDMWTTEMYGEWRGADEAGRPCRYRSLAGVVQRDDVLGLACEAVPAVAAWILSAARMRLLAYIRTAGWENVYYCDTDSVMVNAIGYERLWYAGEVRHKELGILYTKKVSDHVEIRGIKYYVEDGNIVCSGLPRGHCVDARDGEHYWLYTHAQADAAHHIRPSAGRVLRRYYRTMDYTHGVVGEDGAVRPIRLG